jgi:hypothetical protein
MDGNRVLARSLDQLVLVIGGDRYRALALAGIIPAINELTAHGLLLAGQWRPAVTPFRAGTRVSRI